MRKPVTWYVVADRGRARILSDGSGALEEVAAMESPTLHDRAHDLGADRPGHGAEANGGARHAVEPPDFRRKEAHHFAAALAERLSSGLAEAAFERLILVAPARFLSPLRKALSPQVEACVQAALSKDLTRLPAAPLADQLGLLAEETRARLGTR